MKPSERQHLIQLVEALHEGLATEKDVATLEKLVLSDPEALRLYVEALSLHGELFWDAAGAGAEELTTAVEHDTLGTSSVSARPPVSTRQKTKPTWAPFFPSNRGLKLSLLAGGLLLAVTTIVAVWPENSQRDGSGSLASQMTPSADENSGRAPVTTEVDAPPAHLPAMAQQGSPVIPEITLPRVHQSPSQPNPARPSSTPSPSAASLAGSPPAPPTTDVGLVAFINHELERSYAAAGIQPVGRSSDAEWVRRVYLDLAGRIPTVQEAEDFLKSNHAEKRTELVDQLLQSPSFAHAQASVWTNLLVGRSRDERISREQLFAWLSRQFRENRSWRETVEELIAAVGTEEQGPSNFLLAHLNNQAVPATAIASRILLCQQIQCAQCHTHPDVKSWEQAQFWQLNAFFQQTSIKESMRFNPQTGKTEHVRELVNQDRFGPTFYETLRGVMQVAYPQYGGVEVMTEQTRPLRDQLAELLFLESRPQPARAFINRTWAQLFGYGFTIPLDDMGPQTPVSHPELLEGLTAAFVESNYDVKRLIRCICLSDAYQLSSELPRRSNVDSPEAGEQPLFSRMYVKPLTAEQLYDSLTVAAGKPPESLFTRETAQQREQWLSRFYTSVDTEENNEQSTFDGTLPQALVMMNGDLVQQATDLESNAALIEILQNRRLGENERIRQLSLAALSRYPSSAELAEIREMLHRTVKQRVDRNVPVQVAFAEGFKDLYWAYLNSSEFVLNR